MHILKNKYINVPLEIITIKKFNLPINYYIQIKELLSKFNIIYRFYLLI